MRTHVRRPRVVDFGAQSRQTTRYQPIRQLAVEGRDEGVALSAIGSKARQQKQRPIDCQLGVRGVCQRDKREATLRNAPKHVVTAENTRVVD